MNKQARGRESLDQIFESEREYHKVSIKPDTKLSKPSSNSITIMNEKLRTVNNSKFEPLKAIATAINTDNGQKIQKMASKALSLPLSYSSCRSELQQRSKDANVDSEFMERAKISTSSKWKKDLRLRPPFDFVPITKKSHPVEIPAFKHSFSRKYEYQYL